MPPRPKVSCADVRQICLAGRVGQDVAYHSEIHLLPFRQVEILLANCSHVLPDNRVDEHGAVRHPQGFVAFCQNYRREVFRIDFNLAADDEGSRRILVVTAMQVEE